MLFHARGEWAVRGMRHEGSSPSCHPRRCYRGTETSPRTPLSPNTDLHLDICGENNRLFAQIYCAPESTRSMRNLIKKRNFYCSPSGANGYFFKGIVKWTYLQPVLLCWQKMIKAINYFYTSMPLSPPMAHTFYPPDHCAPANAAPWFRSESRSLSLREWMSFWFTLDLLSAAAAAVAEKYLSVLQCIQPWLQRCFIVLEGLGLHLLPIWNVSCLSEWSGAACTMDTQCPGDGAPLHRWEHPVSSRVIIFGQGEKTKWKRWRACGEPQCDVEENWLKECMEIERGLE